MSLLRKVGWVSMGICLLLSGCGGGGAGDGGVSSTRTIVSGSVVAPVAQSAFRQTWSTRLATALLPAAHAQGSRTVTAPDGTVVELLQVDERGRRLDLVTTTSTSRGRYTFDLTTLGLAFSNQLVVEVRDTSGAAMRAFAVAPRVDISPNSEALVQLVIDLAGGAAEQSLENFTAGELRDLQDSAANIPSDGSDTLTLEALVARKRSELLAQESLARYLASASGAGQTAESPGDVGNYFPLHAPSTYRYVQRAGAAGFAPFQSVHYIRKVNVGGSDAVEIRASGAYTYLTKDKNGVYFVGEADFSGGAIERVDRAIPVLRFPLREGDSFATIQDGGSAGVDLDEDGRPETYQRNGVTRVLGHETLILAARVLERCWQVETKVSTLIRLSATQETVTSNLTVHTWYAAGMGRVQETYSEVEEFRGKRFEGGYSIELAGVGFVHEVAGEANDLAYDPKNKRLYASLASEKNAGTNGIAIIDPAKATLERVVPIMGGTPKRIALSSDAGTAYVGVHGGDGQIRKFDTSDFTQTLQFSLGNSTIYPNGALLPFDIEVNPQDAELLGVSSTSSNGFGVGAQLYKRGVRFDSPHSIESSGVEIAFASDGSRLYGISNTSTLSTHSVYLPAELGSIRQVPAQFNWPHPYADGRESANRFQLKRGFAHLSGGEVVDLATGAVRIVQLTEQSGVAVTGLVEVDDQANRSYYLTLRELRAFDATSGSPIGAALEFDSAGLSSDPVNPLRNARRIVRAARGLAISGVKDGRILLVDLPLWIDRDIEVVQPPPAAFDLEVRRVPIGANRIIRDPVRPLIYASAPAIEGKQANSIAVIDPAKGTIVANIAMSSPPGIMAASDDGAYLYVGLREESSVQQIDLRSRTVRTKFPIGSATDCVKRVPEDLEVAPGSNTTVAVTSAPDCVTFGGNKVTVFDNGKPRGNSAFVNYEASRIGFGRDASVLYGVNFDSLTTFRVTADGVTHLSSVAGIGLSDFEFYNGKLYPTRSQNVIDPITNARGISFSYPNVGYFLYDGALDLQNGTAYFFGNEGLASFDAATGKLVKLTTIPTNVGFQPLGLTQMLAWDGRQLALNLQDVSVSTVGQLVLITLLR